MNPPPALRQAAVVSLSNHQDIACAVCGVTGVLLYHDRRSGQKRCKQHRHLRACAECGAAGVTLYVEGGRTLCGLCRNGPVGAASPAPTDATLDLDELRSGFTCREAGSPLDRPRPGPACVTLELCLDSRDLRALQALRLGEPLYKAAQSVGLSNNGLKVHLGRAVIDAWLAR